MISDYADKYRNINFRNNPELYVIGRGEQGVLIAEPYKSEILPYWRFKTESIARESAEKIYELFLMYKKKDDFVGMDMARKFLQMGFTRARRYANHSSGKKYEDQKVIPQDENSEISEKAKASKIFLGYYQKAKNDDHYKQMYQQHKKLEKNFVKI